MLLMRHIARTQCLHCVLQVQTQDLAILIAVPDNRNCYRSTTITMAFVSRPPAHPDSHYEHLRHTLFLELCNPASDNFCFASDGHTLYEFAVGD